MIVVIVPSISIDGIDGLPAVRQRSRPVGV
jgi:hypothetical protein